MNHYNKLEASSHYNDMHRIGALVMRQLKIDSIEITGSVA